MIITATDAKRLLKVIRARAGRASTQIRRIENATKLKRPRAETIANIVTSLQTAYGELRVIEDVLADMLDA